ncbi:MAG: MerR family DNA-binding protein [Polyangiaceae bacterium]
MYGPQPWNMVQRSGLSIGQVAKAVGIGVETIRFYERQGLLSQPERKRSGYRQYSPEAVARVRFIRRAKGLGFTLKEIRELLSLRVDPARTCADVRNFARTKIVEIQERVDELERIQRALERLARSCRGKGPLQECPILEALEKEERRDPG